MIKIKVNVVSNNKTIFSSLEGYLQALDLLYNAVFKLKFNLQVEDYLLDCHFNNEKLRVTDEKGAYLATDIYNNMPKDIIQAKRFSITSFTISSAANFEQI